MAICYDQLAGRFDKRYEHQPFPRVRERLRSLARSKVRKVLEAGCGTGHWLSVLCDLPIELSGIDFSQAMLEKARGRSRAYLICASAEEMPFEANSFDLIFCVNAFHHFSNPKQFLTECRSILRYGGRLAIFGLDPHVANTEWYLYEYFSGVRDKDLVRYLPTSEIKRLMTKAGFKNVVAESVEHIEQTFSDSAVFQDPFLVRESTSQLLLISEKDYLEGKNAIASAVLESKARNQPVLFRINLTLFCTVGEVNGSG